MPTSTPTWSAASKPPTAGLPSPFAEPIDGMHVREIQGDSLFGHFFSDTLANH